MSAPITDLVADMFSSVVDVTPVTRDGYGNATDGTPFSVLCRISGKSRLVRDREGQEVVSTYKLIVPGDNSLTADAHLYTLPAGYSPRDRRKAISVKTVNNDTPDTVHHEVVMLP